MMASRRLPDPESFEVVTVMVRAVAAPTSDAQARIRTVLFIVVKFDL
jgi:hypothetical protein